MRVTYFHRRRRDGANYSIEQIFEELRKQLADRLDAHVWTAPCLSNGLFRRIWIALAARRHQADINHVTGDINFAAILLDPRRTILTNHDCVFLERTTGWRHWLLKWFWLRLPVRRARFVTTVSSEAKRVLLENVDCDPAKVVVIHNAVSPCFQPRPKPFPATGPVRILHLGTAPNKNLHRLIEALHQLDCILVVVGRMDAAAWQLARQGNVTIENLVDLSMEQVVEQYEQCDIVSFVSLAEGFGMPVIEANAVGRPVITSQRSSMPEVAADAACLVDPCDVSAIRAGFEKIRNDADYRNSLIENGFRNVERFQLCSIADQYLQLYNRVATEARQ